MTIEHGLYMRTCKIEGLFMCSIGSFITLHTKLLLVSYTEWWTLAEDVREKGAEEDIWAKEGQGNKGVELHDLYSPNITGVIK